MDLGRPIGSDHTYWDFNINYESGRIPPLNEGRSWFESKIIHKLIVLGDKNEF
jgi:hypothetical protein